MRHSLIACCLAAAALAPCPAAPEVPPQQTARLSIETALAPDAYGRRPTLQAWSPDGKRLTYLWEEGEGKALWSLDAATGKSEVLARLAGLGEDGKPFELDAYAWSPMGDALL